MKGTKYIRIKMIALFVFDPKNIRGSAGRAGRKRGRGRGEHSSRLNDPFSSVGSGYIIPPPDENCETVIFVKKSSAERDNTVSIHGVSISRPSPPLPSGPSHLNPVIQHT